jgi:hypothetical protein
MQPRDHRSDRPAPRLRSARGPVRFPAPEASRRTSEPEPTDREPRCALRSDDTEARHSQGAQATDRERPQVGSCRPAILQLINPTDESPPPDLIDLPDSPDQLGSYISQL